MKKSAPAKQSKKAVKKRFLFFSGLLFLIISFIAFTGYFFAARQINHTYIGQQLVIAGEAVTGRVASEIGSDLILLSNMSTSSAIQYYFANPHDSELRSLALAEFAAFQQESTEGSLFWINNINRIINFFGMPPEAIAPGSPEAVWFVHALLSAEDHNFYITLDRLTGRLNLWASTTVYSVMDGVLEPVGLIGIAFDMAEITRHITDAHRRTHEHIVVYLFNQAGEITSSVNTGLIASRVPLAAHLGDVGAEAIRIADMIVNGQGFNYVAGNYMYRVDAVSVIPGWNALLRYPLPGLLALNEPMNMLFFGMIGLILVLFIIINIFDARSNRTIAKAYAELTQERDIIQAMKDNIHQGIFLMDTDLRILPQYSQPLISILAYYDSDLEGKSLLDILATSLDTTQLQGMRDFFEMMFEKSVSSKVLEEANPISEFEYTIDGHTKILNTRFHLIDEPGSDPVIVGVIQDITREKEFENELQTQKEAQQLEMKNIFDVIQVDPLVFQDFIEDTESNFNYINSILKDRSLTSKQVVTKFFQNVHAMKSNALSLGLETFGKKLHTLEDKIKFVMELSSINEEDILSLVVEFETIMREKDTYVKIVKRINSFKSSNQLDSVLIHSLTRVVETVCEETKKKAELKSGQMDIDLLESNLRKPIKDILFQCVRNSIYHGIETSDERVKKNKKPQGLLAVSVKKTSGKAEITFSDDGRGFDWDKIKTKYLKRYPDAKDTSKKVLLSSVFSPGFSTADDTTTVAGRGVGLSLVRDIVKQNGGSIQADSSESGLTLKFLFPLAS